jgi:hypothetical protein
VQWRAWFKHAPHQLGPAAHLDSSRMASQGRQIRSKLTLGSLTPPRSSGRSSCADLVGCHLPTHSLPSVSRQNHRGYSAASLVSSFAIRSPHAFSSRLLLLTRPESQRAAPGPFLPISKPRPGFFHALPRFMQQFIG